MYPHFRAIVATLFLMALYLMIDNAGTHTNYEDPSLVQILQSINPQLRQNCSVFSKLLLPSIAIVRNSKNKNTKVLCLIVLLLCSKDWVLGYITPICHINEVGEYRTSFAGPNPLREFKRKHPHTGWRCFLLAHNNRGSYNYNQTRFSCSRSHSSDNLSRVV